MQATVAQAPAGVKPIVVESVPWSWGFESALRGESVYEGYTFFCGRRFLEWERGWNAGKALAKRIEDRVLAEVRATMPGAPADLVAGVADVELNGVRYCSSDIDWAAVEDERIGD